VTGARTIPFRQLAGRRRRTANAPGDPGDGYHRAMATATGADIDQAARLLRAGELVAFPTETVYGLGADASNPAAVARIFAAKGRPSDHPVIVHLASQEAVADWAREFPGPARALAARFWPGPLTLVLRRRSRVPDEVTGGQDTVALRVPAHPVAQALLRRFGGGVAAPSANRYGRVSPTRAEHVVDELGDRVALVLDGGDCEVGLESTIVAFAGDRGVLLRPGHISRRELEDVIGPLAAPRSQGPRVPGSKRSHYAPTAPVELVDAQALGTRSKELAAAGVAVLARSEPARQLPGVLWRRMAAEPVAYAHDLYAALRELDATGAARILIERVPGSDAWDAVRDRLARAAAREPVEET
jgi:L-threonylcarbamoyladenylate synthase